MRKPREKEAERNEEQSQIRELGTATHEDQDYTVTNEHMKEMKKEDDRGEEEKQQSQRRERKK